MAVLRKKGPSKRRENIKLGPLLDHYAKDAGTKRAIVNALKPFLVARQCSATKSTSTEDSKAVVVTTNFQADIVAPSNRPVVKYSRIDVPRFHFPYGQPQNKPSVRLGLCLVAEIFKRYDGQADLDCMGEVARALGLPFYLRQPMFSICSGDACEHVTFQNFEAFWKRISKTYHDEAAIAVRILTKDTADYLLPLDLIAVVQDIIDHHPGLECLRDARAYHSTYLETVISRIFFDISRHWSDRIGVSELRRSKLLPALHMLEDEDNINCIRDYFSYEHFYVIYSTFWFLDDDHDLYITKMDLSQYNNRALSACIVDRIMSKAVNCNLTDGQCKMAYSDFIWFLLAEEDKSHPKSIEYWFRCMDLDGDGCLSIYELEYFYDEQISRLDEIGIIAPAFTDILCQMLDLLKPKLNDKITLGDLKRGATHAAFFFDTFFNREKYVLHEENEVNKVADDADVEAENDWDRFARRAYQRLLNMDTVSAEQMEINCDAEEEEEEDDEDMEVNDGQDYLQLAERVAALGRP